MTIDLSQRDGEKQGRRLPCWNVIGRGRLSYLSNTSTKMLARLSRDLDEVNVVKLENIFESFDLTQDMCPAQI